MMINRSLQQRKDKLEKSQNLLVEMRPEFANALKKSISFSCKINIVIELYKETNGRSAFLLKPSSKVKRKRTEIEEVKEEEKQLQENR
jgi:hypothetical protein